MSKIDFRNPLSQEKVLNAGLVGLITVQGDDATPAMVARTSFADNFEEVADQKNWDLDDFLLRKHHDTPYEFPDAIWYMVMPIFVARQMVRHRTASINEESLRYIEPRKEFWIPSIEECKAKAANVKQGSSSDLIDDPQAFIDLVTSNGTNSHADYQFGSNGLGAANELARAMLPLGQYTAWAWKASIRNTFHLLNLRAQNADKTNHAQYQIQVYADSMIRQLRPHFPVLIEAFENHILNAVTFSGDEMELVRLVWKYATPELTETWLTQTGLRKTRIDELRTKLEGRPA